MSPQFILKPADGGTFWDSLSLYNDVGVEPSTFTGQTKMICNLPACARFQLEVFGTGATSSLLEMHFPKLDRHTSDILILGHPVLTTITFPVLRGHIPLPQNPTPTNVWFSIVNNPSLTTIEIPNWSVAGTASTGRMELVNNALSATCVNAILARMVAIGFSSELRLQGGTNAAPTGQGITDKATLISNGATVTTN
jgi:hypothetical protein